MSQAAKFGYIFPVLPQFGPIPTKRNEDAVACPDYIYNNRNMVKRLWARLKEWRAVATRYEKTACSFMGVISLAATLDWLKN